MDNNEFPKSYYSIIPASVRYDKELSDKAKLLYGEISALCNEQGYCWATNTYFAELYDVTKETISRLIKQLSDRNYIFLEFEIDNSRKIYLQCSYEYKHQISIPLLTKKSIGIDENVNSIKNNTINNIKEKEYKEKEKAQRLNDSKNSSLNSEEKEKKYNLPAKKEKEVMAVEEVFEYWNTKNIIKHTLLNADRIKAINKGIKTYGIDKVKEFIDRYSTMLDDENYYYSYKWTIEQFFNRKEGISEFTDEGGKWINYLSQRKITKKEENNYEYL